MKVTLKAERCIFSIFCLLARQKDNRHNCLFFFHSKSTKCSRNCLCLQQKTSNFNCEYSRVYTTDLKLVYHQTADGNLFVTLWLLPKCQAAMSLFWYKLIKWSVATLWHCMCFPSQNISLEQVCANIQFKRSKWLFTLSMSLTFIVMKKINIQFFQYKMCNFPKSKG